MQTLCGTAEISALFGVSRQRASQLTARPGFPEPVAALAMGKVWRTEDVLCWAETQGRQVSPDPRTLRANLADVIDPTERK